MNSLLYKNFYIITRNIVTITFESFFVQIQIDDESIKAFFGRISVHRR